MIARELFARHLDLGPLGNRSRGLVRCVFHADRTPSLSLDLDAGVFCCHGCGKRGGWKAFAELVGERQRVRPAIPCDATPEQAARIEVIEAERRQPWTRAGITDLYDVADLIRERYRRADELRAQATALGDRDEAWDMLAGAGAAEREALAAEAVIDDAMAGRRW